MRAIETVYKGYRFRSRLEARWAVFFDALGIKWEYELEGFELPSGRYLPDFFLPKFSNPNGMYVEVKANDLTRAEMTKAEELAWATKCPVLLAVGTPAPQDYAVIEMQQKYIRGNNSYEAIPGEYELLHMDCCFASKQLANEYRVYWCSGYGADDEMYLEYGVGAAIAAARGARFEFGECGVRA